MVYRERNAGSKIDAHMKDAGFNNQIGIHPHTGFVFGGNEWNCGTWMDKMGSSDKAGNRGKPSTPRDGSAVELVGLQMAALRFLEDLSANKNYPYESVERLSNTGSKVIWTWTEWANKIKDNFEKEFYVGKDDPNKLVNKRGIYKDSVNASQAWTDFQLRCNFPVAMVAVSYFSCLNTKCVSQSFTLNKFSSGARTFRSKSCMGSSQYCTRQASRSIRHENFRSR